MLVELKEILDMFRFDSCPVSCRRHGHGHINKTYLVVTESSKRYILQKINHHVFKNVPRMMDNVIAVTEHLHKKATDPNRVLHLIPTVTGDMYLQHSDGSFWRLYDFIENSVCLDAAETPNDFYESAVAFGRFQEMLSSFPADTLHEIIPNFHNTIDRYRKFHNSISADSVGRCAGVREELKFYLDREQLGGTLQRMLDNGEIPLRVTHNDTKLNNVLFDKNTRKGRCVIDLDTVMPGLSVYDFGDSIRFGAATAAEDEQDLSKMKMDLHLFQVYTQGFLDAAPSLTAQEVKMLPMGALIMTLECGLRFLTDYIDGDLYFRVAYPEHNLVRSRTQMALVADMQAKWEEMNRIVTEEATKRGWVL